MKSLTPHRTTLIFSLALTALLTALPVSPAGAQEQTKAYDLRPLWSDGQKSRYQVTFTRVTTSQIQGQGEPTQSTMHAEIIVDWLVLEAEPEGGGVIRMTITDYSMKITDPAGQTIHIDASTSTDKKRIASMVRIIKALTDSPIKLEVASNGRIVSVEGVQAIQEEAGSSGAGLTKLDFKETASDLAAMVVGNNPVKPGEMWKAHFTWNHRLGKLDYHSTYTLAGVEEIAGIPIAMVNRTTEIDFQPEIPETPENLSIDVRLTEGTQHEQIMFDLSRHEVVGRNISRTLEFEITISAAGRTRTRTMRQTSRSQVLRVAEE